jgi:DNA-3-methyladenine glycosylase
MPTRIDPEMPRPVPAALWQARGTLALALALVGKRLVRRLPDGGLLARRITEVEAYDGERDKACHAARGRTPRSETLYGAGGIWYVFLCYGVHEMLNLVVGPEGWPAAILIRGLDGIEGPGRLTRALQIGRVLNGCPATAASGLWIEDDGLVIPRRRIIASPRIGIDYAGPVWAAKPWRFRIEAAELRRLSADDRRPGSPRRSPP